MAQALGPSEHFSLTRGILVYRRGGRAPLGRVVSAGQPDPSGRDTGGRSHSDFMDWQPDISEGVVGDSPGA